MGGFALAARALGLPKSRLSRRLQLLEERLGVRLIQRSTRGFAVTEIGQEYYRHCVAMLVEAEAAQDVIERSHAEPQGMVRYSWPLAPADLADLPSIDFGPPQRTHQWRLEGPKGQSAVVSHQPRLVTDDLAQMRLAALRGIGVAQMPDFVVDDDLMAGTLVEIIPEWRPRTGVIHAIFPSRRGLLPAVRGLLDFLAREFAEVPRVPHAAAGA